MFLRYIKQRTHPAPLLSTEHSFPTRASLSRHDEHDTTAGIPPLFGHAHTRWCTNPLAKGRKAPSQPVSKTTEIQKGGVRGPKLRTRAKDGRERGSTASERGEELRDFFEFSGVPSEQFCFRFRYQRSSAAGDCVTVGVRYFLAQGSKRQKRNCSIKYQSHGVIYSAGSS